ncbi:MAG: hypothetical protein V3U51_07350 [Thermoplasmata archaeon]
MRSRKIIVCAIALFMVVGAMIMNVPTVMADTFGPEITHVPEAAGTVGLSINVTVNVTDIDGVVNVYLNFTDVSGANSNVTMVFVDDNYSYDIPAQPSAGNVVYNISADDESGNWNRTIDYTVPVSDDTDLPEITHTEAPDTLVDQAITINATVTDNVAVNEVRLNYTDVGGAYDNVTMVLVEGNNYSFSILGQSAAGSVSYFIWANDTNDNANQTGNFTVTVSEDTDPPAITHTAVTTGTQDTAITISATITDDGLGVESATLYYRKSGETTFSTATMTSTDDTYTATILASVVTADGVEYYISATDGVNTATFPATDPETSPQEITVEAEDEEEEEFPWLWIIIGIIIIVVIVVIIIAATRRGGPAIPEEEEIPPVEEEPEEEPEEEALEEEVS